MSIISLQPRPLHEVPLFLFASGIDLAPSSEAHKEMCESADWLFFHSFPSMKAFRTHVPKLPHASPVYSIEGGVGELQAAKAEKAPGLLYRLFHEQMQQGSPSGFSSSFALVQTPVRSSEYEALTETEPRTPSTLKSGAMRNLMTEFEGEPAGGGGGSSVRSLTPETPSIYKNYVLKKARQFDQLLSLVTVPKLPEKAQQLKLRKQKAEGRRSGG